MFAASTDPASPRKFPRCIFLSLTGLECPGCGSTRATHALLHGNLLEAADFNLLYVIAAPWLAWRFANWMLGRSRVENHADHRVLLGVFASIVAFWIARNLPIESLQVLSAARSGPWNG